ncbi:MULTISPECIES: Na+/H+ antiporter subunit E [Deefgea]|uniref:Sodium:proton antiporter n=1 Tax=Deefgea chitinilytica TaxID=570276 RepID=A0ABS2CCE9_9NEIS|nr:MULTISPECIES: Na+/H+ antiporter subunit E [Deefgea]MBM5571717.1 sodium:proton antiporter [Deefgea chitinilytica]MBM9888952.1 Na+/H+ antiporter subunit E [Deefgea sp. CFH1-16]
MKSRLAVAIIRWALLMVLWIVLMGFGKTADLIVGGIAALVASKVSFWLMPPKVQSVQLRQLALFFPHFLWQSVLSGWDVARRALDPKMPLNTGLIQYPVNHSAGFLRNTFASITSLLPGTVPCGQSSKHLEYHVLDINADVCASLKHEEQLLAPVLKDDHSNE